MNAFKTFVDKRQFQKGTFVYFIFLNANSFEQSVIGNIQDDCCKFIFIWIRICNIVTKHEFYKACSFERGSANSFERMWCIPNGSA